VRLGDETYLPNHRFWLSLAATPQAEIIVGIEQSTTRVDFTQSLETPDLRGLLQCYPPLPHDSFFAPSGRVFSIGEGNLVWELRQHAGEALPVSTWGQGTPPPEEQVAAGLRSIYFQDRQVRRISRDASSIQHTRRVPLLRHCPSFEVEEIRLYDHLYDGTTGASFHALSVTEGAVRLESKDGTEQVAAGSMVVIPAAMGDYRLYAEDGPARLLRVYQQAI
jgi:mannose-6-phosphate isomerase